MARTDSGDDHEIPIGPHTLKDVQLVVQSTTVEGIEYLTEHKDIEDKGAELQRPLIPLVITQIMMSKNRMPSKVEDQNGGDLVEALADDHFTHVHAEQWRVSAIRFTVQ